MRRSSWTPPAIASSSKRRSTGRIDPIVALCMALGVAARPAPAIDVASYDRIATMAVWPYNTQRWQRLRRMKLQVNPLCETCLKQKRIEPATAVDHIVAVKAPGGEAYPPLSRLRVTMHLLPQPEDPRRRAAW